MSPGPTTVTSSVTPAAPAAAARDEALDLLRAVGLVLVVLAHVSPPAVLFQLRNFDVPLLVMAAGMSFALSSSVTQWSDYVVRRLKRLVVPVWVFLAGYFLVLHAAEMPSAPDLRTMAGSFMLGSGIGFVWVIRVFLLVALVAPFLQRFDATLGDDRRWLLWWLAAWALWEAVLVFGAPMLEHRVGARVALITHYLLPYAIVFWLGLRVQRMRDGLLWGIAAASAALFAVLAIWQAQLTGGFVQTQAFKYPPGLYYLSFAIAMSIPLWFAARASVARLANLPRLRESVAFVGQNSIWIFLWHIPAVLAFGDGRTLHWALAWAAALLWAVGMTRLQVHVVKNWLLPRIDMAGLRADLRMVLTG